VYYAIAAVLVGLVALTSLALDWTRALPARAQVDVSIEPSMTKGPASAPVTIVEFSDYQ
jgi:hypothetical protein